MTASEKTVLKNQRFGSVPKAARRALWLLVGCVLVAIFSPFIANNPAKTAFPPLIPYASTDLDGQNADFVSPFATQSVASIYHRHWLGTDKIGRDVAAGLVAGTRQAVLVGFGSAFLALLIGLATGITAGFWGDDRLKMPLGGVVLRGCLTILFVFYAGVFTTQFQMSLWLMPILGVVGAGFWALSRFMDSFLGKIPVLNRTITLPVDTVLMRIVEILQSVPVMLWILGILATVERLNTLGLIALIGLVSWMSYARLARAEVLRVRSLDYVEAAQALVLPHWRLLTHHIVPNILTPLAVAGCFGVANAILSEAFISFIGLGLPPEQVTWGTLLNAARENFAAWWLAVFPGLAIFATVYALNRLGEALTQRP